VKGDHKMLLSEEVTSRDTIFAVSRHGGQIEIGSGVSCF
jgi:hypothetical protein